MESSIAKQKLKQFKGQTRLPKFAVPSRYDLTLKPDLVSCTFSGSVQIRISVLEPTSVLVLNALDLTIDDVRFTSSNASQIQPSAVEIVGEDEIALFVFDEMLGVGDGVLGINFSGVLNDSMKGFYKGTYMEGGVKKNMASTQFEAVEARLCFPCWDEPALKATFKVTLIVPSELTALSNMPIAEEVHDDNGLKMVHYEESPLMSTYLVAFVVGAFDYIEDTTNDGIKVRVYCPVGRSNEGHFSLSMAVKSLEFFRQYFLTPYPLPKLDLVGVPDFSAGAMENYGLIVYREVELLHDETHSAAGNKQRRAIVAAHEVAHQWFGNLVTMEWWTHLWLNEGFATWISFLAVDNIIPEWKIWTQFIDETNDGLRLDALEESHPIEVEIGHAHEVNEVFDAISYEKGSSVIRMLQDFLGNDIFQRSLSTYMKRYACKNAMTEDLWEVLSEEAGIQVNTMMDTWTKQKGYPLISVNLQGHVLEFNQSQFLSSGLQGSGNWIVPVTLSVGSYSTVSKFLLNTESESLDISDLLAKYDQNGSDKQAWIKVNLDQIGFYRVKYENELFSRLQKAIQDNALSGIDKFGILDDTYALCEACQLPLSSLLSLMDVYREELDYTVVSRLINVCQTIVRIAGDAIPEIMDELKQFCINLLLYPAHKLGWDAALSESHSNALMRGRVLESLTFLDHDETQKEAVARFQAFLTDNSTQLLPADLRKAAYTAVMRNASIQDRKGFESLLKVYKETDAGQESTRVLRKIASSPDPSLVLEALNMTLTNEIREQDVIFVLPGVSPEGREVAWKWLKDNWEAILDKYGSGRGMLLSRFIRDIVQPLSSYEMLEEVEEFFLHRPNPTVAKTIKQSIEFVRIQARWIEHIRKEEPALRDLIKGLAST